MLQSLRYSLIALLVVGLAFALYRAAVVPAIEPQVQPRAQRPTASPAPPASENQELAQLFEPGAWERQNPKVIETEQAMLLIRDYRPTVDGRVELKPCTLVFFQRGRTGEKRAIVMRSPDGAILQFDRPMDLRRAEVGKLVGGKLSGEITIKSPESRPGAGDDLELVTRNLQLERDRVFTPHEVRFRFGRNWGAGRDLVIQLHRDQEQTDPVKGNGKVSGLKSLELVHVDKVHLELPPAQLAALAPSSSSGKTAAAGASAEIPTGAPVPPPAVDITCKGPFQFDFLQQIASFEDGVDLTRVVSNGASDQLTCQLLEAQFGPPPKTASAPEGSAARGLAPPAPTLTKLSAFGRPVLLQAPSVAASLRAEKLEYDFRERTIRLEDAAGVQLQRQRQHFTAPFIQFQLDPAGGLGALWAAGPGKFHGPIRDGEPAEVETSWAKSLHLRPHDGAQVLSLEQAASLQLPGMGGIAAQQVHLWLRPPPVKTSTTPTGGASGTGAADPPKPSPPNSSPAPSPAASPAGGQAAQWIPEKLLAVGGVQLDSPQFSGRTERLEMWITQGDGEKASAAPRPGAIGASGGSGGLSGTVGGPAGGALGQRVVMSGDLVRVQLANLGGAMSLLETTIDGHVSLTQLGGLPAAAPRGSGGAAPEPQASAEGLTITGERLLLQQPSELDTLLRVVGKPARISARGMVISGANVQLDRRQNHLWIEGPGELTVPLAGGLAAAAKPPKNPPEAPPPASPSSAVGPTAAAAAAAIPARLSWKERLDFNGAVLRFVGGVEVLADAHRAKAAVLDAVLQQPLEFGGTRSASEAALRELVLRGGVSVESQGRGPQGELISLDRMQVEQISLDQVTGNLSALGPGWVSTVRRSEALSSAAQSAGGSAAGGPPVASPTADSSAAAAAPLGGAGSFARVLSSAPPAGAQPAAAPSAGRLLALHVSFEQAIQGNLQRREIRFLERVQAVFGPVSDWQQSPAAVRPDQRGQEGGRLQCDQLTLSEMGLLNSERRPIELVAEGNARIEGDSFTAQAQRVAYTQMKEQLVLEGSGRSDAELWRQSQPGVAASHAAARKIIYWRKNNRVEVEDARFLDLGEATTSPPRR